MAGAVKSQLEFAEPVTDETLNVLLYGAPKTGKTMAAASAPGPILYINADAPNALRLARTKYGDQLRELRFTGLQTMVAVVNELNENDGWATVVVDTVGELYTRLLDDLSGRALRPPINLRGDASTHLERFLRQLCDFEINAVFVAHEYLIDDGGEETERVPLMTSKSGSSAFAAKVAAMVDVIGYSGVVEGADDTPNRYLAQLIPANGRRGGTRFASLGKAREMDISEWIKAVRSETGQSAGKE